LGGEKDDSLEEMEHFVEKPPPTRRRSSSENIPKPKLAGVLGKYKLSITKQKKLLVLGFYIYSKKFRKFCHTLESRALEIYLYNT